MNLRAAALQFFAAPFDLTRNLDTVERLTRQAVAQGAQIVVLPELFNTGYVYTPRLFAFAETEDGLTMRRLHRPTAVTIAASRRARSQHIVIASRLPFGDGCTVGL